MHRTVGVRSALLTARSSAAVATVTTDRRPAWSPSNYPAASTTIIIRRAAADVR